MSNFSCTSYVTIIFHHEFENCPSFPQIFLAVLHDIQLNFDWSMTYDKDHQGQ